MLYIVKSGDSLSKIAVKYGQPIASWKALYNLNKNIIGSNPDLIKPGQTLTIPDSWENVKVLTTSNNRLKPLTAGLKLPKWFYKSDESLNWLKIGLVGLGVYLSITPKRKRIF